MIPINQCFLTREKFDAFVKNNIEYVGILLKGKPVSIAPMLFVDTIDPENGEEGVIAVAIDGDFNDFDEKADALHRIGQHISKEKVVSTAVALMSEAWLSKWNGDKDKPPYSLPRHDPDKREAIIIAALDMSFNHSTIWSQFVNRDSDNRMVSDDMDKLPDGHSAEFPLLKHFFKGFFGKQAEHKRT